MSLQSMKIAKYLLKILAITAAVPSMQPFRFCEALSFFFETHRKHRNWLNLTISS